MGVHPVGGKLDDSVLCDCGIVTGRLRKEIKMKVKWEEDMSDPSTDSFKKVKEFIEIQVFAYRVPRSILECHICKLICSFRVMPASLQATAF